MSDMHAIASSRRSLADADVVALLLHGYGADERDLTSFEAYLPAGIPWVSLRAPQRHPAFGYQWYPITSLETQPEAPVSAATDAVWDWVDSALDAGVRLVTIGFSQGGLIASQLVRTRPDRIAATVLLSGFVLDAPQPADESLTRDRPVVFWGRGDADALIPPAAVVAAHAFLAEHSALEEHTYAGLGHAVSERELLDMREFLTRALSNQ